MVALDDAGAGDVHADLPALRAAQKLGKAAARVAVHGKVIGKVFLGQIGKISGIELLFKAVRGQVGHGQRRQPVRTQRFGGRAAARFGKALERFGQLPQRHGMHRMDAADALRVPHGLAAFKRVQDTGDDVVNVDERQRKIRVAHLDRQPARDVVAEGGDHTVVVGAAPLAEHPLHTENIHRRAGALAVGQDGLLGQALRLAVIVFQRGLHAGSHQHRAGVSGLFKQAEHRVGQAGVAAVKLARLFGAVDACQMDDERRFEAVFGQRFGRVVLFKQQQVAVAARAQRGNQVFAHEPACAGDQHRAAGIKFSSCHPSPAPL